MNFTDSHGGSRRAQMPSPIMVDNLKTLTRLQDDLRSITRLAVDTESNSLFAYHERVCLIQLSTDLRDYLVDPLRIQNKAHLNFLGEIFANPNIEKVLHAAEYDVMTLRRDYGFIFSNLFDTMIAARVLGMERVGLAPMLEERFGIRANKKHQRANWGRRPLSPDMLRYAQMDTHFLLALRDELYEQLKQGGHLEEARELFDEVAQAEWGGVEFDPQGFWRINGAIHLSMREIAILEALWNYREQQARQRDLPVFKIMSDDNLLRLAQSKARSVQELAELGEIGHGIINRYGHELMRVMAQGRQGALPPRPQPREQVDDIIQRRYDALHTWRKERAAQRGVSSEIILSKSALWELAHKAPTTFNALAALPSMGAWRANTYGEELLRVLANIDNPPTSTPQEP